VKRKIITIDESKCNGCGKCVEACAEGALQIVNGKARLVKEQFCDGFGDCLGECPTGALKIVEAQVPAYDPEAVRERLGREFGSEAVRRFEEAAKRHQGPDHPASGHGHHGCPGTQMRMGNRAASSGMPQPTSGSPGHALASDLQQWPVQIHLVQPGAPFFSNHELAVISTCAPVASADIHWRFIRGRAVAVGCPKLDDTGPYAAKLGAILADSTIPKVIVVRMQVPCCGGLTAIVKEAIRLSGRTDLAAEEAVISLEGDLLETRQITV